MTRFICSDLHGDLSLWNHIKEYIQPNDQVWFLGDAADRCPDGWTIIKEMLLHPQITYIKGNHEDMLIKAMDEYLKNDRVRDNAWYNLCYNGGYETFEDWVKEGAKPEWLHLLRKLPHHAAITLADGRVCHLCHAGFSSDRFDFESPTVSHDLLWDRKHIEDDVEDDTCLVIHGHTPVQHLDASPENLRDPAPLAYDNKIDIDLGTPSSGRICLLDVDALKPKFVDKEGVWW